MSIDDLDLYGDDEHPAAYDDTPPPLAVGDPDWQRRASWHLRTIDRLETEKARLDRAFDDEIERLRTRRDELIGRLDKKIAWHTEPLTSYHAAILEQDPKAKTIRLPGGELCSRTPRSPRLAVQDPERFVEWATTNAPECLSVKVSADRAAIDTGIKFGRFAPVTEPAPGDEVPVIDEHGVVIPGVVMKLGLPSFHVITEGSEL
jgi:phage host-nuclease inhibitor protein Gam